MSHTNIFILIFCIIIDKNNPIYESLSGFNLKEAGDKNYK